jgi:hypothetical protein
MNRHIALHAAVVIYSTKYLPFSSSRYTNTEASQHLMSPEPLHHVCCLILFESECFDHTYLLFCIACSKHTYRSGETSVEQL